MAHTRSTTTREARAPGSAGPSVALGAFGLLSLLLSLLLSVAAGAGCQKTGNPMLDGGPEVDAGPRQDAGPPDSGPPPACEMGDTWCELLENRALDYGAALRAASLRIRGVPPTLEEIQMLNAAGDETATAAAYRAQIDGYLSDPRSRRQIIELYRNAFHAGGPGLDSAAAFAARLIDEDRDFGELLTATAGECPSFDEGTLEFADGECVNGLPTEEHSGVLTNPEILRKNFGNLAFLRVRWIQESLVCNALPAETGEIQDVGGAVPYTSPWPFTSIAGQYTHPTTGEVFDNGGRINFLSIEAATCANCHSTMNHRAPLFGRFDEMGIFQPGEAFQVALPIDDPDPTARMSDWLVDGETTAWRYEVPVATIPEMGRAMLEDREVNECTVARLWNWALGRREMVSTEDVVPPEVIAPLVDAYLGEHGRRLRPVLLDIFTSEDFTHFYASRGPGDATRDDGPADFRARLHGCRKLPHQTVGSMLASFGLTTTNSAAYRRWESPGSRPALGAANFGASVAELDELNNSVASTLFDIFVEAAPEIIGLFADPASSIPGCTVGGGHPALFSRDGLSCGRDGLSCLLGTRATDAHLAACALLISEAPTPEEGQQIVIASLLAGSYTCE